MHSFFSKKCCFAVFFIGFLLIFGGANIIYSQEELKELAEDFSGIGNIKELEDWIGEVETETNEAILCRMQFVETYGFLQKVMDKREFNSFAYIQDDEDMLYYGSVMEQTMEDLTEYAQNVDRMKAYAESHGAKFMLVLPPSKVIPGLNNVNLSWPLNNPNNRIDKLMLLMHEYGVEAMDMRTTMLKSGKNLEDLFFKTDHHWTPLAAYYAAVDMSEQMKIRFGISWDMDSPYLKLENYHSYTYSQCFLGSTGRNTGAAYSGMDDYTLMWPECGMDFVWTNYEKKEKRRTGKFTEALLLNSVFEDLKDVYDINSNRVYLDQVTDHDKIVNLSNPNGPKLLVLRDSYFSPMACFLAPLCSEIEMLWTRNSQGIDMEEFVKERDFDYLILEVYPYNLDEQSFDFFHAE